MTPPPHDLGPEPTPPDTDTPPEEVPQEPDVPDVDIPDTDVPLDTVTPPQEPEVPEVDEPPVDVPQTGDNTGPWLALTAASGTGLAVLTITGRKRKPEMG